MALRIVVWGLGLGLALTAAGCASIVRGTGEQVSFDTVPSGAEVRVTIASTVATQDAQGYALPPPTMGCVTPCVLQVKRADRMAVSVTKDGFEKEGFALDPQASGAGAVTTVLGNFWMGAAGVIGAVVDGASGAMLDRCPNPVRITLRPLPAPVRGGAPQWSNGATFDPVQACKAQDEAKYAVNRTPGEDVAR